MSSALTNSHRLDLIKTSVQTVLDSQSVPSELSDALLDAITTMSRHYAYGEMRPSELNAGDFIEAVMRILQWLGTGRYTPLNRTLPPMPTWVTNMENSSLDDSLRIIVPRLLNALYAIRSRRGVSHIAGDVSANAVDALLLLTTCRWILAEFIRLFHGVDHDEAQKAVDLLAIHESPLVEDFEGIRRIITAKPLPIPSQILILLNTSPLGELRSEDLYASIKGSTATLRVAVTRLDSKNLVHKFSDNRLKLTGLGRAQAHIILAAL